MCSNAWEMVSKIQGGKCTDSSLCFKKGSEYILCFHPESSGSHIHTVFSPPQPLSSAWLCLTDIILRTISLSGSCQCLAESVCSARFLSDFSDPAAIFFFVLFLSSDLDHFKVHTRSAVSVREGQGVVLLCGTPTSSGGEPLSLALIKDDFSMN